MLEEPPLNHADILAVLRDAYGLNTIEIAFLPVGADVHTAAYRIATEDNQEYFLKLRNSTFNIASVAVPVQLQASGMRQVISPLTSKSGALAAELGPYTAILYPYIAGRNAIEAKLSEAQWLDFGASLKRLHTTEFPRAITRGVPRESFAPRWRDEARRLLRRVEQETFREPVAAELAAFLGTKATETLDLVNRAEDFARNLERQHLDYVLCHGDIHGWNLLIDEKGGLYIVDWDTLILGPKERDLMFIGAGLGATGYSVEEEQRLFYRGYGPTYVDQGAIAYYRFERIVEDVAAYCEQVFNSTDGLEDRRQAVENVKSNFLPGSTLQRAYEAGAASKQG